MAGEHDLARLVPRLRRGARGRTFQCSRGSCVLGPPSTWFARMKIRDPHTLRRVATVASHLARVWYHTLAYAYRPLTTYLVNDRPELLGDARYVYAFWHEHLFIPSYVYAQPDTAVLVGLHRDGELLSRLHEHFGLRLIRASSSPRRPPPPPPLLPHP